MFPRRLLGLRRAVREKVGERPGGGTCAGVVCSSALLSSCCKVRAECCLLGPRCYYALGKTDFFLLAEPGIDRTVLLEGNMLSFHNNQELSLCPLLPGLNS